MIDIVGLESIGKYIIWLWSKYVKRKHIPYMDLEFHYPNYDIIQNIVSCPSLRKLRSLAAFHLTVLRQTLAITPDFPYLRPPKHKTHYAS